MNRLNDWLRESGRFIWELLKIIVLSVAIIVPVRLFLVQPFYVQGASMWPNFIQNDYLLVDEISFGLRGPISNKRILGGRPPERGEIIVFKCTMPTCGSSAGDYLIKRVVGLPGDTVQLRHVGKVKIVNNQYPKGLTLQEPYRAPIDDPNQVYPHFPQEEQNVKITEDHYFALGDNRDVSFDSEDFGQIPFSAIVGRVWLRGWPFSRATVFPRQDYLSNPPK